MISMKTKWFTLFIVLFFIALIGCAKSFLWKGSYATIKTKDIPKEDFIVGKYIVISYAMMEHKKDPAVLYQFVICENGRQARLITVERHREFETPFMPMIFLEETNSSGHFTYTSYNVPPVYQEVKEHVIGILSGDK